MAWTLLATVMAAILLVGIVVAQSEEIQVTDDGVKYLVDPSKIRGGGPPKDGIPSIDNPKYTTVAEADNWIQDNELVLAITYKGVKRVYPLQIMVWHEIVNDVIEGDPILISYCPLCGSGLAFERVINEVEVEFGTSGKLYNSNLVMYDRSTDTYWSQINGLAILGELTGMKLTPISMDTVVWRDWKVAHPDSEVLTRETGYSRAYGVDPYGNYYEDTFLFSEVENQDNRIHPKTVIFGINVDGVYKAYQEKDLLQQSEKPEPAPEPESKGFFESILNLLKKLFGAEPEKTKPVEPIEVSNETTEILDTVNGINIRVTRDPAGIVAITNLETGEEIIKERDFWFAWYAFHPETELYIP